MSDDRFDRDLTDVLREIAGEEAPMSLRNRLSDITERAPMGRRLWFATPMRLSMVAAAAVAVLALAILFWPRQDVGPSPSDSPSPSVAPSPSTEPSASPSGEPTPIPTVAPTPVPTPTPEAPWTGLAWSDPVTPPFTVHLTDLVPWGDGYVAGGVASVVEDAGGVAAFLTSADGLDWAVAEQISSGYPGFLTVLDLTILDDELYAFSHPAAEALPDQPLIWRSVDGSDWSAVDPTGWDEAWSNVRGGPLPATWDQTQHAIPTGLVDVASGPGGIVAIGNSIADDGLIPIVLHSSDGENWSQVSLPAGSVSPLLNEVVPYHGAFVIVGATDIGADPSTATPAAWFSDDGTTWIRGTMNVDATLFPEGSVGTGFEMGAAAAGADGLVGWMGHREITIGGPRFTGDWTSADGQTWQMRDANTYPPSYTAHVAGDGGRMVALPNTFHEDTGELSPIDTAWVSTDGLTWNELALSAAMTDPLEGFWVVPDGVIYAGVQSFWFGAAQVAE